MRVRVVTAREAEARAIGPVDGISMVISGVGRTNAAAATAEAIIRQWNRGPGFDAVINAGIAGALPESDLSLGDALLASSCIYVEEGLVTSKGFVGIQGMGFPLGDFDGNAVPVDADLLERLSPQFRIG